MTNRLRPSVVVSRCTPPIDMTGTGRISATLSLGIRPPCRGACQISSLSVSSMLNTTHHAQSTATTSHAAHSTSSTTLVNGPVVVNAMSTNAGTSPTVTTTSPKSSSHRLMGDIPYSAL